jgi:PhzF family phenazine biosynthesis protein
MQEFANWTNLSETTFLAPPTHPDADYRVRIFTTTTELPFAGHPTLGSCHAWLATGGHARRADPGADEGGSHIVQECGVGLVTIRQDGERLAFAAPPLIRSGVVDAETRVRVIDQLQIEDDEVVDIVWADNGPGWIGVMLSGVEAVLAVRSRANGDLKLGVVGLYPPGSPFTYEVRGFFPANGMVFEDPVTGSLNASLAQWLLGNGVVTAPYVASQGTVMGRAGRVYVDHVDGGPVWIGGHSVTCISGTVELGGSAAMP